MDGTLACWGKAGQVSPPGGTFAAVGARFWHTCGVRTDGTLACWGDHEYGRATPPDGTFAAGADGIFQPCGEKTDELLACWVGA